MDTLKSKKLTVKVAVAFLLITCLSASTNAQAAENYLWPVPVSTNLSLSYSSGHEAIDIATASAM